MLTENFAHQQHHKSQSTPYRESLTEAPPLYYNILSIYVHMIINNVFDRYTDNPWLGLENWLENGTWDFAWISNSVKPDFIHLSQTDTKLCVNYHINGDRWQGKSCTQNGKVICMFNISGKTYRAS